MGCLAKIEEILQDKMNREEWNLDLSDSNRPQTVTSDKLAAGEIVELISKAGFKNRTNEMRVIALVENTSIFKDYKSKHGLCLYIETKSINCYLI